MPKDTPNQQIKKLTAEKRELAKRCNDLEQRLNAIYSRNQDPDILTMYHQLEDRMAILLENLKTERAKNQELQKQLDEMDSESVSTKDIELEYRLDAILEELKEERALTKKLKAELNSTKKKKVGRPNKITKEVEQEILQLRKDGETIRSIASKLSLSIGLVSDVIKENK